MEIRTCTGDAMKISMKSVPTSGPRTEKVNCKTRQSKGMNPGNASEKTSLFRLYYIPRRPLEIRINVKNFSDMGRAMSYFTRVLGAEY
jgi:hypothetical protein